MICQRTLIYSSYTPYSIYFRMAVSVKTPQNVRPTSPDPSRLGDAVRWLMDEVPWEAAGTLRA